MSEALLQMKKIIIFGGQGMIGSRFLELKKNIFEIIAPTMGEVDILKKETTEKFIKNNNPDVIINFAAFTNVDEAQKEDGRKAGIVYKTNSEAVLDLSVICKKENVFLIHISTGYVFDGKKNDFPYTEEDESNPIGWYSTTKYFGEKFLMESGCKFNIIRIENPYSHHYERKRDLARSFLNKLQEKQEIYAIDDIKITPILVDDIADSLEILVQQEKMGIFHIASTDFITPYLFAKTIAQEFGCNLNLLKTISFEEYHKSRGVPRPRDTWLSSKKFEDTFGKGILHTNEENVKRFKFLIDSQTKQ